MSKLILVIRPIIILLLLCVAIIMVYPLIFSALAGLMQREEFTHVGTLLPISAHPTWQWYKVLFQSDGLPELFNTIYRTVWYTIVTAVMACLMGYVLSRMRFPGRSFFFGWVLFAQLIPGALTLIPAYIIMARFPLVGGNDLFGMGGHGFINSPLALYVILPTSSLVAVFLFKQSMDSVPKDYEEAAAIDGCGFIRTVFTVVLPIQKPIMATISLTTAISTWNDFLTPFTYINNIKYSTVSALIAMITSGSGLPGQQTNYPLIFALATLTVIPPLVIFLSMQRYIVQGFAAAGIKG